MAEQVQVMDSKQVADYLGVTKATIYKWVELRKIPYTKVGSLLRFPKWLIDRHLSKKATHPDETLYEEFERLYSRFHLEKFLKSQGLDYALMDEEQLVDQLRHAIKQLKETGQVTLSPPTQADLVGVEPD